MRIDIASCDWPSGAESVEMAGVVLTDPEDASVPRAQNALTAIMVPAKTREAFKRLLSSWFISTFTPAQRVEHDDLIHALSLVGIQPPSRRELMGKQLDALYNSTKQNVAAHLQSNRYVAITMDGWKKRVAEQGAPLVTVNLLMPDGGARFWKVWTLCTLPI
jgi:hypothetical protein